MYIIILFSIGMKAPNLLIKKNMDDWTYFLKSIIGISIGSFVCTCVTWQRGHAYVGLEETQYSLHSHQSSLSHFLERHEVSA
jgi:hypothetical protein